MVAERKEEEKEPREEHQQQSEPQPGLEQGLLFDLRSSSTTLTRNEPLHPREVVVARKVEAMKAEGNVLTRLHPHETSNKAEVLQLSLENHPVRFQSALFEIFEILIESVIPTDAELSLILLPLPDELIKVTRGYLSGEYLTYEMLLLLYYQVRYSPLSSCQLLALQLLGKQEGTSFSDFMLWVGTQCSLQQITLLYSFGFDSVLQRVSNRDKIVSDFREAWMLLQHARLDLAAQIDLDQERIVNVFVGAMISHIQHQLEICAVLPKSISFSESPESPHSPPSQSYGHSSWRFYEMKYVTVLNAANSPLLAAIIARFAKFGINLTYTPNWGSFELDL